MLIEGVQAFSGGLAKSSIYNAVFNPIINFDFNNSHYDRSFRLGVLVIGDSDNNFQYKNAYQNISNMSAQREVRLSEFNYFQRINHATNIRLGIMDMRDYLNSYDVPKVLFNSGFGTNRVMNNAAQVATYPYSGFGALINYAYEYFELQVAAYQGNPQHLGSLFKDGALFVEQINLDFPIKQAHQQVIYFKFGLWQNYQPNPEIGFSNIGLYVMSQYAWLTNNSGQMSVFAQLGYGNNRRNLLPYSFAFGITSVGIIPQRDKDQLALGATTIWLRSLKAETAIECTYALYLFRDCYLNPDLQYIINPRGDLTNSWAGVLRLTYNFNGHLLARR